MNQGHQVSARFLTFPKALDLNLKISHTPIMGVVEDMNQRIANGEFGNPVDMYRVNAAWAEILEKVQGKQPTYTSISGLWAESNSSKVAYSGRTQEEVNIPAGTKVLCFVRDSDNPKAPDLGLVYVTYDD